MFKIQGNKLYVFVVFLLSYFLGQSFAGVQYDWGVWILVETVLTTHLSRTVLFSAYLDNLENSYSWVR